MPNEMLEKQPSAVLIWAEANAERNVGTTAICSVDPG